MDRTPGLVELGLVLFDECEFLGVAVFNPLLVLLLHLQVAFLKHLQFLLMAAKIALKLSQQLLLVPVLLIYDLLQPLKLPSQPHHHLLPILCLIPLLILPPLALRS